LNKEKEIKKLKLICFNLPTRSQDVH